MTSSSSLSRGFILADGIVLACIAFIMMIVIVYVCYNCLLDKKNKKVVGGGGLDDVKNTRGHLITAADIMQMSCDQEDLEEHVGLDNPLFISATSSSSSTLSHDQNEEISSVNENMSTEALDPLNVLSNKVYSKCTHHNFQRCAEVNTDNDTDDDDGNVALLRHKGATKRADSRETPDYSSDNDDGDDDENDSDSEAELNTNSSDIVNWTHKSIATIV